MCSIRRDDYDPGVFLKAFPLDQFIHDHDRGLYIGKKGVLDGLSIHPASPCRAIIHGSTVDEDVDTTFEIGVHCVCNLGCAFGSGDVCHYANQFGSSEVWSGIVESGDGV